MQHQTRIVFGKPKLGQVHRRKAKGIVLPVVCGERPEMEEHESAEQSESRTTDED